MCETLHAQYTLKRGDTLFCIIIVLVNCNPVHCTVYTFISPNTAKLYKISHTMPEGQQRL